jgi:hypothetical protein
MLLPQIYHKIPAYSPAAEDRLSFMIRRETPFLMWIDHIRMTRFRDKNFYRWTMDHPHENIIEYFSMIPREFTPPDPIVPDRMKPQDTGWVIPEKSIQWKNVLDTIALLKKKNNRVAALITPFNEYMLTEKSLESYKKIVISIIRELHSEGMPVFAPGLTGRENYADSSHPLEQGYAIIADELILDPEFASFVAED